MKMGVLGGTFDPVHLGHLRMAEEAMSELGLSEVIMVPAGRPRLKPARPITSAEHRLQMLRLATAGQRGLSVSTLELERPGPSYTVDTISELKSRPGHDEIYCILGWDSLAQLADWQEPERLAKMCYLVAVPRPGYPRPDVKALEKNIPGLSKRVVFLKGPLMDISASALRERVSRELPVSDLIPGPVVEYIRRHKLYQNQLEVSREGFGDCWQSKKER